MLKKYVAPGKLRLAGKAWEIRRSLRLLAKLHGERSRLSEITSDKPLSRTADR